jgi:hypothetical protein
MGGERASWGPTKTELEKLRELVKKAAATRKDPDGTLSDAEVKLAEQALHEINAIITLMGPCPQGLSPYRK